TILPDHSRGSASCRTKGAQDSTTFPEGHPAARRERHRQASAQRATPSRSTALARTSGHLGGTAGRTALLLQGFWPLLMPLRPYSGRDDEHSQTSFSWSCLGERLLDSTLAGGFT